MLLTNPLLKIKSNETMKTKNKYIQCTCNWCGGWGNKASVSESPLVSVSLLIARESSKSLLSQLLIKQMW